MTPPGTRFKNGKINTWQFPETSDNQYIESWISQDYLRQNAFKFENAHSVRDNYLSLWAVKKTQNFVN